MECSVIGERMPGSFQSVRLARISRSRQQSSVAGRCISAMKDGSRLSQIHIHKLIYKWGFRWFSIIRQKADSRGALKSAILSDSYGPRKALDFCRRPIERCGTFFEPRKWARGAPGRPAKGAGKQISILFVSRAISSSKTSPHRPLGPSAKSRLLRGRTATRIALFPGPLEIGLFGGGGGGGEGCGGGGGGRLKNILKPHLSIALKYDLR